jgi:hypothetical protein
MSCVTSDMHPLIAPRPASLRQDNIFPYLAAWPLPSRLLRCGDIAYIPIGFDGFALSSTRKSSFCVVVPQKVLARFRTSGDSSAPDQGEASSVVPTSPACYGRPDQLFYRAPSPGVWPEPMALWRNNLERTVRQPPSEGVWSA